MATMFKDIDALESFVKKAVGYLIFKNAGGYCCAFQSEEIFINSLQPRSVITAVNEPLFNEWKSWVQNAQG